MARRRPTAVAEAVDRRAPAWVPQALVPHADASWPASRSSARSCCSLLWRPLVTTHDPATQDLLNTLAGPSRTHPLGTDDLGRDVWARLVYGARTDLRVAFLAVLFPFVIGTLAGLLAGYFGGRVDTLASWLVNVVVAFPFYVLDHRARVRARLRAPATSTSRSRSSAWVSYARIVRGEVLVAKRREYVLAARARRPLATRADPRPAPAPERDHAGDRLRDVRHRAQHPRDRHARLPRARRPAADARLGRDDRRRPDLPDDALGSSRRSRASRS